MRLRNSVRTKGTPLAVALVLALLAASCGSSSSDGAEAASEASAADVSEASEASEAPAEKSDDGAIDDDAMEAEAVTIRMTWWGNPERDEKTEAMIDAFEEAYPHITVEAEPTVFDGYFDKLSVGFAAGDAPDVITLGGAYPTEYGSQGALVDLSTMAELSGLDNYDPNSYSAATLDGAVYGVPTGGNARGMLINEALFTEAGIELPDDSSWTWADYVALSGELSAALADDVYGTDWRIQEIKEEFAAQRGSEMYLAGGGLGVTLETMTELFSIPADLLDNGGMPSAEKVTELAGTGMEETLFGQGKAAMMPGYSNNVQNFADILGTDVRIVKIPGESEFGASGLSVLPSQFFAVTSGSDHPEEAAMLLDWMLNEPVAAKIILGNRGLSFNPAILTEIQPLLGTHEAQSAEYLAQIAEEGRGVLPVPTEGKGEVDELTTRLQDSVLFGKSSPAEAAAEWLEEAGGIIP